MYISRVFRPLGSPLLSPLSQEPYTSSLPSVEFFFFYQLYVGFEGSFLWRRIIFLPLDPKPMRCRSLFLCSAIYSVSQMSSFQQTFPFLVPRRFVHFCRKFPWTCRPDPPPPDCFSMRGGFFRRWRGRLQFWLVNFPDSIILSGLPFTLRSCGFFFPPLHV